MQSALSCQGPKRSVTELKSWWQPLIAVMSSLESFYNPYFNTKVLRDFYTISEILGTSADYVGPRGKIMIPVRRKEICSCPG